MYMYMSESEIPDYALLIFVFKHLWQLFSASLAYACKKKIIIRQLINEWFIIRNYKLNLHKLKINAG